MMRLLLLHILLILPAAGAPPEPVKTGAFHAAVTVDPRTGEIAGTVRTWLTVLGDSASALRFTVPASYDIEAVRDIDEDRFPYRRTGTASGRAEYTVTLPSFRYRGDSLFLSVEFEAALDSSSHLRSFINPREFILLNAAPDGWLPSFGARTADSASLLLSVDGPHRVMAGTPADTVTDDEGSRRHRFAAAGPVPLSEFFSLCGSMLLSERSVTAHDPPVTVTLLADTSRLDARYADSLIAFLADAASYYRRLSGRGGPFVQRFAVIGDDDILQEPFRTGTLVIARNTPALAVFDTAAFRRSTRNPWLSELARRFRLASADSLALLDDGWSGYLATRYILHRNGGAGTERRERLDLMINALSFYPAAPLSAGRRNRANENEVLSYKGRFLFLMLEDLLGREAFDSAVTALYALESPGPADLQRLSEASYGTPLDRFFDQWLNRSGAPEYAMRWSQTTTPRGRTLVTLSVEQRGDLFTGPVRFVYTVGAKRIPKMFRLDQQRQEFTFAAPAPVRSVELDPDLTLLRWLLDIRILAHARSSRLFRSLDRDISTAEREARLALDLDPANATGSAPVAYFSLGKLAVIERDMERAKEHFLKAMRSAPTEETALYPLLSLVRYANVLEMEGLRSEALPLYERARSEGRKDPALFAPVIIEAEKYLRIPFVSADDLWYGTY